MSKENELEKFLFSNVIYFFMQEIELPEKTAKDKDVLLKCIRRIKNIFNLSCMDIDTTVKVDILSKVYADPEERKKQAANRALYFSEKAKIAMKKNISYAAYIYFSRAVQAEPEVAEHYGNRAIVLYDLKENRRTSSDIYDALRLNPYCHQANLILGHINYKREKWHEALKAYAKALKAQPHNEEYKQLVKKVVWRIKIITAKRDVLIRYLLGGCSIEEAEREVEAKEAKRVEIAKKAEEAKKAQEAKMAADRSKLRIRPSLLSMIEGMDTDHPSLITMIDEIPQVTESMESMYVGPKTASELPEQSSAAEQGSIGTSILPANPEAEPGSSSGTSLYEDAETISLTTLAPVDPSVITSVVPTEFKKPGTSDADTITEQLEGMYIDAFSETVNTENVDVCTSAVNFNIRSINASTETIQILTISVGTNTDPVTNIDTITNSVQEIESADAAVETVQILTTNTSAGTELEVTNTSTEMQRVIYADAGTTALTLETKDVATSPRRGDDGTDEDDVFLDSLENVIE